MFEVVFTIVLILRFGVPLFIPKFPLPAIIAALIIDGVDQTLFQQVTDDPLEWYQGYDKSLDIYYLSIAYLSTIRNWIDPFAFKVGQFLWYYRLVGVVLFELTDERWLRAMDAIGDACQVVGSKSYIRVYERIGDSDQYRAISLDIAGV